MRFYLLLKFPLHLGNLAQHLFDIESKAICASTPTVIDGSAVVPFDGL